MKTRVYFAVAALTVAVVSAALLTHPQSRAADKPAAPEVVVAPVIERIVSDTDEFTGRLQAVDTIAIRPRINGYVDSVEFSEGARVKRGQLLFRIDPRPYQAELDRLTANLAQARSEQGLADANAERATRLVSQHAVSREEADRQLQAAVGARSQVAATQAALEAARLNREFTEVRAPIDGKVSNALITRGNLVTPSDVLTTVVSVDPVYAYFDVDEQSFLRFESKRQATGAEPKVVMALANESGFPHEGKVDFIDNQLKTGTGTIRLRAVFANAEGRFTPGLYARIQLSADDRQSRTLVDDRAIGTDLGNKYVYVVGQDRKIQYRKVVTGVLVDGLRVVTEGLSANELVVVNGIQRIKPGLEVTTRQQTIATRGSPATGAVAGKTVSAN